MKTNSFRTYVLNRISSQIVALEQILETMKREKQLPPEYIRTIYILRSVASVMNSVTSSNLNLEEVNKFLNEIEKQINLVSKIRSIT